MLAAANSQPHEGGCVRGRKTDHSGMLKIVYFNRVENSEDVEWGWGKYLTQRRGERRDGGLELTV